MPTLAEQMAADALEAMKVSRKFFVVELDFSLESLDKFEDLFSQWRFAMPGGDKPENVEKLVRVWGAYLGETIRRARGGEWILGTGEGAERIALRGTSVELWPHDVVRRRLFNESCENLLTFYAAIPAEF